MQDTCYLPGLLPKAGLLARSRVITLKPVVCQVVLLLIPQHIHHGIVMYFLLGVLLCGVVDVLVEGALDLLCPVIYIVAPDVEVIESLAELMVTSSQK